MRAEVPLLLAGILAAGGCKEDVVADMGVCDRGTTELKSRDVFQLKDQRLNFGQGSVILERRINDEIAVTSKGVDVFVNNTSLKIPRDHEFAPHLIEVGGDMSFRKDNDPQVYPYKLTTTYDLRTYSLRKGTIQGHPQASDLVVEAKFTCKDPSKKTSSSEMQ